MMTWSDVINYADNGSPEPDKRVVKSHEEWKAVLTPEQFRIT